MPIVGIILAIVGFLIYINFNPSVKTMRMVDSAKQEQVRKEQDAASNVATAKRLLEQKEWYIVAPGKVSAEPLVVGVDQPEVWFDYEGSDFFANGNYGGQPSMAVYHYRGKRIRFERNEDPLAIQTACGKLLKYHFVE